MVTNVQKGIIGLTIFTALVHLFLAISSVGDTVFLLLFALNFAGYIFLLVAIFYLSEFYGSRTMFGTSLMIYAFITIVAYVVVRFEGSILDLILNPLGIVTKLAELVLIYLVYYDMKERQSI